MKTLKSSFEQVMKEHQELRHLNGELRSFLEAPRPEVGEQGAHTWAAGLAEKMVDLHDKLFRHFREEERSGFLEELSQRYPRASRKIETLRREHDRILCDLRAILGAVMTYSEAKTPQQVHLRRWVLKTLDQLDQHESEENDLITQLYNQDLGTGD